MYDNLECLITLVVRAQVLKNIPGILRNNNMLFIYLLYTHLYVSYECKKIISYMIPQYLLRSIVGVRVALFCQLMAKRHLSHL